MAKKSEYLRELERQYAEKHRLRLKLQKELKELDKKKSVKKKTVKKKTVKRAVKKKAVKKKAVKRKVVKKKLKLPKLSHPKVKQEKLPVMVYSEKKKKKGLFDGIFDTKKKSPKKAKKKKGLFGDVLKPKKVVKKKAVKKKKRLFEGLLKTKSSSKQSKYKKKGPGFEKILKDVFLEDERQILVDKNVKKKKKLPILKIEERELPSLPKRKKKSLFAIFKKKRRLVKKSVGRVAKPKAGYKEGPGFGKVLKDVFLGDEKKIYLDDKPKKKKLPPLKYKKKDLKVPVPKKKKRSLFDSLFKKKKVEPKKKFDPLVFPDLRGIVPKKDIRKVAVPIGARKAVEEKHILRKDPLTLFLGKIRVDKQKLYEEERRKAEERRNEHVVKALQKKLDKASEHVLSEPSHKMGELIDLCFISIKKKNVSKAEFYYEQMKPYYDLLGGNAKRHAYPVVMCLQNDLVMLRLKLFKEFLKKRKL